MLFGIALQRAAPARWPLDDETAEALRPWLLETLGILLGLFWVVGLGAEGRAAPLPYLPIVNPLELAQLGFLLFLLIWYRQAEAEGKALFDAETRARFIALLGIVLLTVITLRSVLWGAAVVFGDQDVHVHSMLHRRRGGRGQDAPNSSWKIS